MNKTIMFLGMLAVSFANAQQTNNYDGKVAINHTEPKATLDIEAFTKDGSKKEGILIPRMSKANIAKITDPVISTLIYINETSNYTSGTDTNADTRVANIDTVGFYHYNGKQWVKHLDTDTNTSIWTRQYKNIALLDSDLDNIIQYTTEGQYWNIPKRLRNVSDFDPKTLTTTTIAIDFNNDIKQIGQAGVINLGYADKLFTSNPNALWKGKKLSSNFLLVDEQNDGSNINRLYTQQNTLHINEQATKNYQSLYAQVNDVEHYGSGTADILIGSYNNAGIIKGTAKRIVGTFNQVGSRATTASNVLEATYNMANPRGQGQINGLYGTRNHIILDQRSSNKIISAIGSNNQIEVSDTFTGTIDNISGVYVTFNGIKNNTSIKEMYGLKISNANKGTDVINGYTKNYAIHTEQGKVKLGDDVMIKTDIIAPKSSLTVQGHIAVGEHSPSTNRALFIGASGGTLTPGGFIGFGAYTNGQTGYNTTRDNATDLKHRFFLINDMRKGKFHFSPFTANDGKVEESFDPISEAAMTISHEGKKIGIGTHYPAQKLDVAGSIKIGSTDDTCDATKAGTIRFKDSKFQGCANNTWVDLH